MCIMSKLSIFDSRWTDIVFDGRNKEYGAYQLRKENGITTLKAFFSAVGCVLIPVFFMSFSTTTNVAKSPVLDCPIELSLVVLKDPNDNKAITPLPADTKQKTFKKPEKTNLVNLTIIEQSHDLPEIATNNEVISQPIQEGIEGATTNTVAINGTTEGTNTSNTNTYTAGTINSNAVFRAASLDKRPDFPGGMDKFYTFIINNFKASSENKNDLIKMSVSFIIEKDGSISEVKVLKNPGYGLDKEAIRVLNKLKTKWHPGTLQGQPVRTLITMPIVIKSQ